MQHERPRSLRQHKWNSGKSEARERVGLVGVEVGGQRKGLHLVTYKYITRNWECCQALNVNLQRISFVSAVDC